MTKGKTKFKKASAGFAIVLSYAVKHRVEISILVALSLTKSLTSAFIPLTFGKFIDSLIPGTEVTLFGMLLLSSFSILAVLVAIKLFGVALTYASGRISRRVMLKVANSYQVRVSETLLHYPVEFFKNQKIGKTNEIIGRAKSGIQNLIGYQIPFFGVEILSVVFALVITFYISAVVGGILAFGLFVFGTVIFLVIKKLQVAVEKSNKANNQASSDFYESLGNALEVKRSNTIEQEIEKTKSNYFGKVFPADLAEQYLWITNSAARRTVFISTQGAVFLVSIFMVQAGTMTIGELTAVNTYVGSTFMPFIRLSDMWLYLQTSMIKIKEAEDMLSEKSEQDKQTASIIPEKVTGEVEFNKVSFAYEKKGNTVLKNISFKATPGTTTAMVGKSGVGKSTVVELLGGFYFPQKGKVLVDSIQTSRINLHFLRSHLAYVSQEVSLFNDTILNNIKYGVGRKVSIKEVEEAAKKAYCHDFITQFPKGYKTKVGTRGVKLSVGQKQRIAIARAILRNPTILILDEPTSALDSESEEYITKSLKTLMKGRTTFIIAHRLSTVRDADNILVFQEGKITEQGTHTKLMKLPKGHYKELYSKHVGLS